MSMVTFSGFFDGPKSLDEDFLQAMADIEHIGLLIDGDTIYGAVSGAGASSAPGPWRFAQPAVSPASGDDAGGDAESSEASAPAAPELPDFAGALRTARTALHADDGCVLALPSDELITKVISLPPVEPEAIPAMVRLQMEKLSVETDDALEVASEVIGATEDATRVFAVAMPMSKLDKLAEALSASGTVLSRIDSALLCQWRMYADCAEKPEPADCYAVLFVLPSGRCDLVIADQAGPVFARSVGANGLDDDIVREITLSILSLGSELNGLEPSRIVVVSAEAPGEDFSGKLSASLDVETSWLDAAKVGSYADGVVRRDAEEGHLDIVPRAWREVEEQTAAKGRFMTGIYIALFVWALLAAAMYFVPRYVKHRTAAVDVALSKVTPAYRVVADTRTKVRLIRSYQDRSHSLLDVLRLVCSEMPDGITFSSLSYEKGGELVQGGKTKSVGGIKIVGDADRSGTVLAFKDVLDDSGMFVPAKLTGPTMDGKRQRYRFEIDSRFVDEEAAQ